MNLNRLQLALGLVLLMGFLLAFPVWGQGSVLEAELGHEYAFGQQITFRAGFPPDISIDRVELFFQTNGDPTVVEAATLEGGEWKYVHDVQARYVRSFGTVTYWFRATTTAGTVGETERVSFLYEDNRFEWQTLEGVPFRVHWYAGTSAFAQFVLDTARFGAQQAGLILDTEFPEIVEIYVYGQAAEYQFVRNVMGPQWAGGHADPSAGVIVVSLPPGETQRLEVERKIPHEVAHLMLYQATGEGFWSLPAWLNEGFASTMERNPNPDYPFLVGSAVEEGALIPMAVLCQPFPRDASGAVLAYAEATSFVRFIQEKYEEEGVRALVQAYANGAGCEFGTEAAPVNLPLSQLERAWREEALAENVTLTAFRELAPWLVLLGAVMVGPVIVLVSFRKSGR